MSWKPMNPALREQAKTAKAASPGKSSTKDLSSREQRRLEARQAKKANERKER